MVRCPHDSTVEVVVNVVPGGKWSLFLPQMIRSHFFHGWFISDSSWRWLSKLRTLVSSVYHLKRYKGGAGGVPFPPKNFSGLFLKVLHRPLTAPLVAKLAPPVASPQMKMSGIAPDKVHGVLPQLVPFAKHMRCCIASTLRRLACLFFCRFCQLIDHDRNCSTHDLFRWLVLAEAE